MSKIRVKHIVDVDDGVRHHQLQEPPHQSTNSRREHDGSRAGDIGVAAFLRQVEWCVVAGHRPDYGDEAHKNRHAIGEIRAFVEIAPDCAALGKSRQPLRSSVRGRRNRDDRDDQSNDVEGATVRVECGNPPRWHRRDACMNDHDQGGEEEHLVVLWHKVGVLNRSGCEYH